MSSTYRQYQEARDTAWRALLRLKEKRMPVEPEALFDTLENLIESSQREDMKHER